MTDAIETIEFGRCDRCNERDVRCVRAEAIGLTDLSVELCQLCIKKLFIASLPAWRKKSREALGVAEFINRLDNMDEYLYDDNELFGEVYKFDDCGQAAEFVATLKTAAALLREVFE